MLASLAQAYVAPFLDLRFVTSYTNDGANVSSHTFQRRFSRRYLQYRGPAPTVPQPGALAGTRDLLLPAPGAALPAPPAGLGGPAGVLGGGSPGGATQNGAAGSRTAAAEAAAAAADADVALDDGALADSERSLSKTLGPVDPSLKMLMRKAAQGLVQYVQKAHLLTLRGVVCEFVRDGEGHLWFMGPLRTEWASLTPGGWS